MTPAPPAPEPPGPSEPVGQPEPQEPIATTAPDPATPAPTDPPQEPIGNGTVSPNGTNATNVTTAGEGGFLPEINGWDLLVQAMAGAVDSLAAGVAALVDGFHYHLLTLPAPGEPTAPSTWSPPSDPYWQAAFVIYWSLAVIMLPLVWGIGWTNVGLPRGASRRDRIETLLVALAGILAGWTLLAIWFHFWNTAALAFAPEGAEFLSTPGSGLKLGVGIVLGLALLAVKAIIVLLGLAVHLAFVFLTFCLVALWPLWVGLYASKITVVSPLGTAGLVATLILAPIQFCKAVILRLIFEFPLDPAAPETATTFLLIIVGVLLAFVVLPYYGLKYLTPQSIVATGGRVGTNAGDRMDSFRNRAPSGETIRERVTTAVPDGGSRLGRRGGGDGGRLQSRRREGNTGTGSGTTYRSAPDYKRGGGSDTRSRSRTRSNGSGTDGDNT